MAENGEASIGHHHHRSMSEKRKSSTQISAEVDFATTLYGLTSGHHDLPCSNTLSAGNSHRSSLLTSEHHSGKSIKSQLHSRDVSLINSINQELN